MVARGADQLFPSLSRLLDRCGKNETLINQIHARAITLGLFRTHQHFASKLLNLYAKKLNNPPKAHSIFNQIHNPDIVSWTCLMSLYLQNQQPLKTLSLFSDMISSSLGELKPDGHCIVAALSACGSAKKLVVGKMVHGMVLKYELGGEGPIVFNALIDFYSRNTRIDLARRVFESMVAKDVASWTSLLNGYIICGGDIVSAGQLFDEMPVRNVISWTAMIVGYVRSKSVIHGLKLFQEMRTECIHPTSITVVAVLSGCADVGALDFGGSLHGYVNKIASLVTDVSVNNALIDMYCKGGDLELARRVFMKMPQKDVFSWTSLISGLALHGKGRSTLQVFGDMVSSGRTPNEITFLSVLSACGHGGLIGEGQSLFNKMVHDYGLKPTIKHYGCMVDLVCRAGLLDEALELIDKMPFEPDAVIWRSVLSGCMIKRDLELAEMAAKKVLELEPYDDGVYILLWNVYRLTNKWEDALKTRKMMRSQNIKKQPGCSWIEINGVVHEFTAETTMHEFDTEMHTTLQVVGEQSRYIIL